ncbi:MAG TPA: glycosyltransferase family 2 protein [Mycobacteriales bacterium]|nr:glycosyltransferase family 2 protein [Mycobacteriales bacterium]HVV76610.1 glycosyltransferase family 2 protein [Mycobacteriales bacterium]
MPDRARRRDNPPARRLSIVLPAYNEEANIEAAVTRASEVAGRHCTDHEVIVVDDGSADTTAAIVEKLAAADPRIRLVKHETNQGYGGALKSGFLAATMELVFFTDSDNQFDLDELGVFIDLIQSVDVVAGYRIKRRDPFFRRINARAWNYLVRALFYVPVRDIDCAFKLFRREVFDGLELNSVGAMVNTELMVKLGRSGYRVVEVGVSHFPRTAGKPQGASIRVIVRAFTELRRMHSHLATMELAHLPAGGRTASSIPPRTEA